VLYNVAQLMKASIGASLAADIHEEGVQFDEDLKVIGPVDGFVRLRRINQGILADGWVDLTLEFTCNRCLKEFQRPMHVTFLEQFQPTIDIITGVALPPIEEEDVFAIDDHHQVDLTEAVRQRVLLEIPMVPICREDCAGLCPQCGQDLNAGPCACQPAEDSRFTILKELLQDM